MGEPDIARRKADHLEVAASGRADFEKSTLLEHVHLVHQALPELALDAIDLSTELAGCKLKAPVVITGMTGGTGDATQVNKDLARAAQAAGVAFGVGSQRAMAEHPEYEASYQVRDVAPDVALFGNVGGVQLLAMGAPRVIELAKRIGANAICVHLNPGQELIQARGDRDFRGVLAGIATLVETGALPVIVKETGCGLSPHAAAQLVSIGVHTVDTAGAGGTSWVAVEAVRATDADAQSLGHELWDWGVPTAVSVVACKAAGLSTIASGGLRSGYDIARALALGARAGGFAAPALRAQQAGGREAVEHLLAQVATSIRSVCLLAGCGKAADLAKAPRHLGRELRSYLEDLGL